MRKHGHVRTSGTGYSTGIHGFKSCKLSFGIKNTWDYNHNEATHLKPTSLVVSYQQLPNKSPKRPGHLPTKHNTTQHNTVQHNAAQHNTSTTQYNAAQYKRIQVEMRQDKTAQGNTKPQQTTLHSTPQISITRHEMKS